MTAKAISVLNKNGHPYILMVEGASIDKESHINNAAGQLWDTIEFDKAIKVGRAFAGSANGNLNTLVLVSADHDQSMHIVGLTDTTVPGSVTNTRSNSTYPVVGAPPPPTSTSGLSNPGEVGGFPDYADANGDGYPENTNRFRIAVGYRSGNHTGSSVPITAEGAGALLFVGYFDQTDIFFKMAKILSSNTSPLDNALGEKSKLPIINQNY
jgi:alkaline phosphatase